MALEPGAGVIGHLLQRPWLLEQVSRAGHDDDFFLAVKQGVSFPVHFDDRLVVTANNQERRGGDA